MKTLLLVLLAAISVGCANHTLKPGKNDGCCGLTKEQSKQYDEKAADAVLNPRAWTKAGSNKPKTVQPTARSNLFKATNSPNGIKPPTEVTVHVPIGNSVEGCTHVVVDFSHPDGKIKAMHTTTIRYF